MSDEWDFYQCQVEGKPASIMLDMGIHSQTPMAHFQDMAYLRLFLQRPAANGMTTSEEMDILNPFEDALSEVAKENGAIYVGRVTTDGIRDFVFYASDRDAFERELTSAATAFTGYRFEIGSRWDPEWTVYQNYLYPSGRLLRLMDNRRVYDALEKDGDPLTAPREVDHWAYFATSHARGDFIQNAMRKGFQVRVMLEPDSQTSEFGVTVFRRDVPSPDGLDDVTVMLFDFAEAAGGRYDGWEAPVKKVAR
ncbi:MAG TPA: DUF695 domain-containing protein [Rhizomicrobium sp.]|nr:DUF695 domain-containing protein [Rhizomicrobium sp.]